jgi:hypothetical protein
LSSQNDATNYDSGQEICAIPLGPNKLKENGITQCSMNYHAVMSMYLKQWTFLPVFQYLPYLSNLTLWDYHLSSSLKAAFRAALIVMVRS